MNELFNKKFLVRAGLVLPFLMIIILVVTDAAGFRRVAQVKAAPDAQILIFTPTPRPDGRIIYIVQANDTLLSISLLTGVPVDELRGLNNLTTDTIFEGQELLIGLAGPPETTPTAGPTPTPTSVLPTPTPRPGQGNLCILLFDDVNGDSIRQENEPSIPGGAISFGNRDGSISETIDTGSGLEPKCFENIPEGDYTITVAVPSGYNPTTVTSFELTLNPGDETYLNFGAQANTQTQAEQQVIPTDGGRSPILGIVGGIFLLAGVGVAICATRFLRSGK